MCYERIFYKIIFKLILIDCMYLSITEYSVILVLKIKGIYIFIWLKNPEVVLAFSKILAQIERPQPHFYLSVISAPKILESQGEKLQRQQVNNYMIKIYVL